MIGKIKSPKQTLHGLTDQIIKRKLSQNSQDRNKETINTTKPETSKQEHPNRAKRKAKNDEHFPRITKKTKTNTDEILSITFKELIDKVILSIFSVEEKLQNEANKILSNTIIPLRQNRTLNYDEKEKKALEKIIISIKKIKKQCCINLSEDKIIRILLKKMCEIAKNNLESKLQNAAKEISSNTIIPLRQNRTLNYDEKKKKVLEKIIESSKKIKKQFSTSLIEGNINQILLEKAVDLSKSTFTEEKQETQIKVETIEQIGQINSYSH
ncbi:MAG: hypothetical protein HRK26_03605 [Rickettsiaceae bacterium H1]|nr:hypothetical protein [Rickettsiaceae bacterium H1]